VVRVLVLISSPFCNGPLRLYTILSTLLEERALKQYNRARSER
jgi:hypothetical protein